MNQEILISNLSGWINAESPVSKRSEEPTIVKVIRKKIAQYPLFPLKKADDFAGDHVCENIPTIQAEPLKKSLNDPRKMAESELIPKTAG